MFCRHKWKILSETKTESVVEKAKRLGISIKALYSWDFDKQLIQILTCEKCGKLKRFTSDI